MRDFLIETFIPVLAQFLAVAACISVVIFALAIANDIISNPTDEIAWSDAQ